MKTEFALALLSLVLIGCSTPSKYAHDPRAAVVGPDFLDYTDQYPMDRDTQFYYPHFVLADARVIETRATDDSSSVPPNVTALLIKRPDPAPEAMDMEGKGWPKLERDGIPFSEVAGYEKHVNEILNFEF